MPQVLASTILRLEEWRQPDGAGVLELRGGELDLALLVYGAPRIFDAADCCGSVGRLVALLPAADPVRIAGEISQRAAQGFTAGDALSLQIAPLLALLPRGDYRLTLEQLPRSYHIIDWTLYDPVERHIVASHYSDWESGGFWPTLCPTQPMYEPTLDDATLNRYLSLLDGGHKPALITIGARSRDALRLGRAPQAVRALVLRHAAARPAHRVPASQADLV